MGKRNSFWRTLLFSVGGWALLMSLTACPVKVPKTVRSRIPGASGETRLDVKVHVSPIANKNNPVAVDLVLGQSVASGSWDEIVRLWNVRSGEARVLGKNCSCICCLAFSPKGDQVAACSLDSRIRVWDIATAKSRTVGLCDSVNSIAFSTDGKMLVTGSADGTIRLWSVGV
jgi:WD40 repeat protein